MRNELKALEGQLVYVLGRVTEARINADSLDALMPRPRLHRWDGKSPLREESPIPTDHLWVRTGREGLGVEMLETAVVIGRVGYYRRANGTVDLGVKAVPGFDVDVMAREATALVGMVPTVGIKFAEHALEVVDTAIAYLDNQGVEGWAFSRFASCGESLKCFRRWHEQLERTIEANESRLATGAPKGHRPRGLDLGLRNNRRSLARGMA